MENATEALIIAFAVMVFVIALSTTMMVNGQAKETADYVFYATDKTNFRDEYEEKKANYRIVGMETIVPTIYRQFKENFNVIILDKTGDNQYKKVAVYNTYEEGQLMNKTKAKIKEQGYEPRYSKVVWMGSNDEDGRKRVDLDLKGHWSPNLTLSEKKKYLINGQDYMPQTQYEEDYVKQTDWLKLDDGLLDYLSGKGFEEHYLEQRFSGKEISSPEKEYSLELVKGNTKMWIVYIHTNEADDIIKGTA